MFRRRRAPVFSKVAFRVADGKQFLAAVLVCAIHISWTRLRSLVNKKLPHHLNVDARSDSCWGWMDLNKSWP